jgi:hypothetical protein
VGEDSDGQTVVIENQLEKSDHDHLGKLITYVAALEAKSAVWIVAQPRPEHVQAVNWLNSSGSTPFYLVQLEAVRIDDSRPAPLLTLITGPSEVTAQAGKAKRELAGRHQVLHEFWTQLLELARQRTGLHANIKAGDDSWIGTSAGISGLALNYVIRKNNASVELYIDRGRDRDADNIALYAHLERNRSEIEERFDGPLKWERLEGRRACRVSAPLDVGGLQDRDRWPAIQEAMVDAMIRFDRALRPHLSALPSGAATVSGTSTPVGLKSQAEA